MIYNEIYFFSKIKIINLKEKRKLKPMSVYKPEDDQLTDEGKRNNIYLEFMKKHA